MWLMPVAMAVVVVAAACGVDALDNGFTTPPMGWSALYGAPFHAVSEAIVLGAGRGLVKGGLAAHGYEYVNLDDWYADRTAQGEIVGDPKVFPRGIPFVSLELHKLGLKFGVYSAASQRTCGNWSASEFREDADAKTFAHVWEIDYLKYDSCLYNNGVASRARYMAMSRALNRTGRPIRYSVEGWNPAQGDWGPELANMWRSGNDIWPRWDACVLRNVYENNLAAPYQRVGQAFNDPDMLQPPGSIPGTTAEPGLTFDESQSQFVLWSIMKAPLILGLHWDQLANLSTSFPDYYGLITNPELIAINQDRSKQATLVCQTPSAHQQRSTSKDAQAAATVSTASTTPGTTPPPTLNVTLQPCDLTRCDQRWVASNLSAHGIQAASGTLCLTQSLSDGGHLVATPCNGSVSQVWGELDTVAAIQRAKGPSETCLTVDRQNGALGLEKCAYDGPLPPPLGSYVMDQLFVWDYQSQHIVSGGLGTCLTLGMPNIVPGQHWITNNGTLHHEVWRGTLSSGKEVVVLFNKGPEQETLFADWDVLFPQGRATAVPVRNILQRKDLAPLGPAQPLQALVPSHGVAAFILG